MMTVQEWLRKTDENTLADEYIASYPFNPIQVRDKSQTVQDLLARGKDNFIAFIRMLKDIETKPNGEGRECVIFGCKTIREGYCETDSYMCYLDELLRDDVPAHYAYTFTDFSKVMGYYIADTPYTRRHIEEILISILYEISFTGYTQEEKEQERQKLDEAIQESTGQSTGVPIEELWKSLGMEPEPPDEDADKLRRKVQEAEHAFSQFCFQREVSLIRTMLREECSD